MIAMAHRGRLNVLAHVLQKPYAQVLAEFKDPLYARSGRIDLGWMGDVKYHAGARHEVAARRPAAVADRSACRRTRATSRRSIRCWSAWRARRRPPLRPARAARRCTREGARHPDSRRRGVSRSGRRRRNAQPVAARRLRGRRHDPHHRQQPARLHRRCRRSRTAPATRAASRAASRSRSSTSTPTMRWRASKRRGWPGPTGSGSSSTS